MDLSAIRSTRLIAEFSLLRAELVTTHEEFVSGEESHRTEAFTKSMMVSRQDHRFAEMEDRWDKVFADRDCIEPDEPELWKAYVQDIEGAVEVGPTAATFPSEKCLSSWVGACPGDDESAGVNYSHRSPKGNRHMRRLLNQTANAAARTKGSIFEIVYRRSVPRLGHNQAIGAIAHRQCRLIWLILHQGVRYEERGPAVTKQSKQKRTARMIRQLRSFGYRIEAPNPQPSQAQAQ